MPESTEHPMYGYIRQNAGMPMFYISRIYGVGAAAMTTEILAAFGMNVKNETGLVNQLSERVPVAFRNGIPTFTYARRGEQQPFLLPPVRFEDHTYPAFFIHTEGSARPVYVRRSHLIDWVIDAAQSLHDARRKPQQRDTVLHHFFEAGQLVARRKGLIDW